MHLLEGKPALDFVNFDKFGNFKDFQSNEIRNVVDHDK